MQELFNEIRKSPSTIPKQPAAGEDFLCFIRIMG